MLQLTIKIEKDTLQKLEKAARAKNMSENEWVLNIIKERLADEWPAEIVALAGSWQDSTRD